MSGRTGSLHMVQCKYEAQVKNLHIPAEVQLRIDRS